MLNVFIFTSIIQVLMRVYCRVELGFFYWI